MREPTVVRKTSRAFPAPATHGFVAAFDPRAEESRS